MSKITVPVGTFGITEAEGWLVGVNFINKSKRQNFLSIKTNRGVSSGSEITKEISEYFEGKRMNFSVKVKFLGGTAFQRRVWQEIGKIPFGEVITYKELAKRVGRPRAVRAVAGACGKNPVPIVIPCHRVVGSGGKLGGYSGGLAVKEWLLEHEQKAVDT